MAIIDPPMPTEPEPRKARTSRRASGAPGAASASSEPAVVVTGIVGRLGKSLARALHRERRVIGIDRRAFPDRPKDIEHHEIDIRRTKQILVNLLGNAVKFTPEGGKVGVRITTIAEGVQIAVSDTGIGMTPEGIAKALTLFGQVDGRLARQYEGSGLGLPISQRLAEIMGGRLEISSVPDQGTTVTVTLPPECIARD